MSQDGWRPGLEENEDALVQVMRSRFSDLPIDLSLYDEMSVARASMATGVDGFVLKRAIATDMLDAAAAVVSGQTYISPGIRGLHMPISMELLP